MEEVLNKLESTGISHGADKTQFDSLYKYWGRFTSQDQRRKELLEVQKSNRKCKYDEFRGILDLIKAVEKETPFKGYAEACYRPSIYVAGFNKVAYSHVLTLSEWMVERPCDFETNWLVVPCPKGVRTLVVACNGITKIFSKYGQFMSECRTALPGGNPCQVKSKVKCCVLDCFYEKTLNIMYVLDILAWNSQAMTDGEVEFRHYWLMSQLADLPGLTVLSKNNKMIFKILPKVSCAREPFNEFMMKYPQFETDPYSLDGLLFYHKKAHYVSGQTPLVVWLFPYMVNEVLGQDITVNKEYMDDMPKDYTNQADFIKEFEKKTEKRQAKRRGKRGTRRDSEMSVMDTQDNTKDSVRDTIETDETISEHKPLGNIESKPETMEAEVVPDITDKTGDAMEAEITTKNSSKD